MKEEYPLEFFIKLEGNENFLGRLTVNIAKDGHFCEVDIVQAESRKIFHHVKNLYGLPDQFEAIESGRRTLAMFLQKKDETNL